MKLFLKILAATSVLTLLFIIFIVYAVMAAPSGKKEETKPPPPIDASIMNLYHCTINPFWMDGKHYAMVKCLKAN